jgi:hypothetical protein
VNANNRQTDDTEIAILIFTDILSIKIGRILGTIVKAYSKARLSKPRE